LMILDTQKSAVFNCFVRDKNGKYWKKIFFSHHKLSFPLLSFLLLDIYNIAHLFNKMHRHWSPNFLNIDCLIPPFLLMHVQQFYINYQCDPRKKK
jgi:hypothetical protein